MKPVTARVRVFDMAEVVQSRVGENGTCFRACIASILELKESQVMDFDKDTKGDEEKYWSNVHNWLSKQGLTYRRVPIDSAKPSGYSTIEGVSPRGGLHACVAFNGELIHDPHPQDGTGRGLVEPRYYGVFEIVGKARDTSFENKVKIGKSVENERYVELRKFLPYANKGPLSNGPSNRSVRERTQIPLNKVVGIQESLNRDKLLSMYNAPLSSLQEPVSVVAKGGKYYIQNGHHRAAVLKARGQKYINVVIETQATDRADMMQLRNNTKKQGGPFLVQVTEKDGYTHTVPTKYLKT